MEQSPFRLETLRALREHAEACAKHALAEELAVGAKRHADLRRAEEALEQARQAAADAHKLDGTGLAARDAFIARRQRERVVAQQWAVAQERRITESREALAQAARSRSAFERLKEKAFAAHEATLRRREDAFLGELALNRHLREQQA
jgi:flagellar export protein FliJ